MEHLSASYATVANSLHEIGRGYPCSFAKHLSTFSPLLQNVLFVCRLTFRVIRLPQEMTHRSSSADGGWAAEDHAYGVSCGYTQSLIHAVCRIFWITRGFHTRHAASWHILRYTQAITGCHCRTLSGSCGYKLPLSSVFVFFFNLPYNLAAYIAPFLGTSCPSPIPPAFNLWHLSLPVYHPFSSFLLFFVPPLRLA